MSDDTPTADAPASDTASRGRTETGRVTSTAMQQTATVQVERRVKHPIYGKYIRRSKKYHVHDAADELKVGDTVQIRECRPISKTKSWTLDKVLVQARD